MMEAHTDLPLVGTDPYMDSMDYITRMTAERDERMCRLLESIEVNIERLSNFTPRQFSKETPTCIDLGPLSGRTGAGTTAGAVFQTTQRFRVTYLLMGGAAGDNIRLKSGQNPYNFFGTGNMVSIPFEIQIDRGTDISVANITTPAAVAWTFMLFGYSE